ncbi:unnamed protein product [Dovyalis caffra]|uniref:Uncharacterized protein n=1 Tax=Dovyalis caffra TaxID=77055 RepID=A0AAV1S8J7_9ROSI|nr:unnamed protein product [Dovyalis caffra]
MEVEARSDRAQLLISGMDDKCVSTRAHGDIKGIKGLTASTLFLTDHLFHEEVFPFLVPRVRVVSGFVMHGLAWPGQVWSAILNTAYARTLSPGLGGKLPDMRGAFVFLYEKGSKVQKLSCAVQEAIQALARRTSPADIHWAQTSLVSEQGKRSGLLLLGDKLSEPIWVLLEEEPKPLGSVHWPIERKQKVKDQQGLQCFSLTPIGTRDDSAVNSPTPACHLLAFSGV